MTDRAVAPWFPVVAVFSAATVLGQIAYPLLHGSSRDHLTIVLVVLFTLASLSHAWVSRGGRVAIAVLLATAVPGLTVEVLGVHTGYPFGHYAYTATLGVHVWGVPLVIAFAWTMLAWPAALVARRLVRSLAARVAVGGWALASWDLFLDPQMVSAGHWRWRFPAPHLPGVGQVPLTNYAGWFLVATLISLVLQGILCLVDDADDRWPYALYLWTWASSVLALAAFLGLGASALWGGIGMGLVAGPLAMSLARRR